MRTLPDAVRGNSDTTRTSSGHFWRASPTRSQVLGDLAQVDGRHPGREPHHGAHVLAEPGIGRGDDRDLGDVGEGRDRLFDLGRGDVLAAADDHVLQTVGDREEAVGVEDAHVAGAVPAVVVEGVGAQRRIGVADAQVGPA